MRTSLQVVENANQICEGAKSLKTLAPAVLIAVYCIYPYTHTRSIAEEKIKERNAR